MGKLILTGLGMAAGFFIGGPMGAQIGAMIGGIVGAELFGPTTQGPRLNDLTVSASTYGNAIPRLFGTSRLSSNMIWSGGIKEHKHSQRVGKGGQKTVNYTYTASFAVAFCAGTIDDVIRIWADTKVIYHNSVTGVAGSGSYTDAQAKALNSNKQNLTYKFRIYRGTPDQMPDPTMEAVDGAGEVPGYRDLCYIVFEDLPLDNFGNRIPQISAEVTKSSQRITPTIRFLDESGSAFNFFASNPYVDWKNNVMYSDSNGLMRTYSLDTMKQISAVGLEATPYEPGGIAHGTVVWPGVAVGERGASNARPIFVHDPYSGRLISQIGSPGGSIGVVVSFGPGLTNHVDPVAYTQICGLEAILAFQVGDIVYLTMRGPFGSRATFTTTGRWVDWFAPNIMCNCSQNEQYTEVFEGSLSGGVFSGTMWRFNTNAIYDGHFLDDGTPIPDYYNARRAHAVGFAMPAGVSGNVVSVWSVTYCPGEDAIVVTGGYTKAGVGTPYAAKFTATGELVWFVDTPGAMSGAQPTSRAIGNLAFLVAGGLLDLNLDDGSYEIIPCGTAAFEYCSYDGATKSMCTWTFAGFALQGFSRVFITNSASNVTLSSICEEIMTDTGLLTDADIDLTAMPDIPVTGYAITREATARDCLQQLATAYQFDGVESDYKLKLVGRGHNPVLSLTQANLANVQGRDVQVKETISQEVEMPMRYTINYMDQARDYQIGSQYAKRITQPDQTVNTRKEVKNDLPIVMTATQAKQRADITLKTLWLNRITCEIKLPWRYLKYDPTDVITVALNNGSSRDIRIDKFDIGADMSIQASGATEHQVAYTSAVTAADAGDFIGGQIIGPSPASTPLVINTPLLKDSHDTGGRGSVVYLTAFSKMPNFKNAIIEIGDGTDTWIDAATITSAPYAGTTMNSKLPPTRSWGATDTTTRLKVRLYDATLTLESITYDELMAGGNMALVGNEVIQFQNADLNIDGSYTLSNILRGRRGTNTRVNEHENYERFLFLPDDQSRLDGYVRSYATFFEDKYFRSVSAGTIESDAAQEKDTLTPADLRPYTLEGFSVSDDGTTVTIICHRRSRLEFGIRDYTTQAPYAEGPTVRNAVAYMRTATTFADVDAQYTSSIRRYEDMPETFRRPSGIPMQSFPIDITETTSGTFHAIQFTFPYADTGSDFVLETYEEGYEIGFTKAVQCHRASDGVWDVTELY